MARVVRDLTVLSDPKGLIRMNHAFAFTAEAGPHFTDPGGWKAESAYRHSWLVIYLGGLPVRRRSPIAVITGPDVD